LVSNDLSMIGSCFFKDSTSSRSNYLNSMIVQKLCSRIANPLGSNNDSAR
jgi:hypothetical protein